MHAVSHLALQTGMTMEIEQWGHGDDPLILVHGYTGSRDDWREHLPALANLGQTIAVDQRGHGGSTNSNDPDAYSFGRLADDLGSALDQLGFERVHLLGHSMGGITALNTTLAQPDRIASLILMDTTSRGVPLIPQAMRDASVAIIENAGMQGLADVLRKGAESGRAAQAPAAAAAVERMGADLWWGRITAKLLAMDPIGFRELGGELADWPGVSQRLGEIKCPTTVIVGEQDVPFRGPSEELVAGIEGAHSVVIQNAAHSPQLENPEAWFEAITDHLARSRA